MRRPALLLAVLALLGCPASDQSTADTAGADTGAAAGGSEAAALAGMAGTWNMRTMPEQGDSVLVTYVVRATSDTTGWTLTFPGRDPLPVRIIDVDADSVVLEVGPYESMLRPGVQVVTRSVSRTQGDRMMGTAVARYTGAGVGADSVVRMRTEGTRAP